jgi:hypothetical protein
MGFVDPTADFRSGGPSPPLELPSIFFSFHDTLPFDALGLQITAKECLERILPHPSLVMAVFYLAKHGVLQELPHTFPAGAFCGVPTIFQHVCILESEGSYFGVVQSHTCRRPQSSARERPSAARKALRCQFFSVGGHATGQKAALARACSSVPFIYPFGIFLLPFLSFLPLALFTLSSPELTFLPAMTWVKI